VAGKDAKMVAWDYCFPSGVELLVPAGYTFVALVTFPVSDNFYSARLPAIMALMVGSEQSGIPGNMKFPGQVDLHIPMPGPVKSMNLSPAASVCLFERVRLWV